MTTRLLDAWFLMAPTSGELCAEDMWLSNGSQRTLILDLMTIKSICIFANPSYEKNSENSVSCVCVVPAANSMSLKHWETVHVIWYDPGLLEEGLLTWDLRPISVSAYEGFLVGN